MTDTIVPEQTNNSTTNIDSAESIELLKNQIAELKAQLVLPKKQEVEFLPSQTNSNKTLLLEREKGAVLSKECDVLESNIMDYKDLLQSTVREGIDAFIKEMKTNCVDDDGLTDRELKRNLLAFLNCRVFFGIDGVTVPEHLQSKVEKVKNAKSYSLAIKDEINDLLSHLPYMTNKLKEIETRKKNANIVLDEFGNTKSGVGSQGDAFYLNSYFSGKLTLEECKKNLSSDYREKIKTHIASNAKKAGYEISQMPTMSIQNYAKAFEPLTPSEASIN